jgi:hypothetical protein
VSFIWAAVFSFLTSLRSCQPKKGAATKSSSAVVVSDGEQSDDHSDTGSVIYVKAKPKTKDPIPKDSSSDDASKDSTTGEAADAMAVDEPTKVCLSSSRAPTRPSTWTDGTPARFYPVRLWSSGPQRYQ